MPDGPADTKVCDINMLDRPKAEKARAIFRFARRGLFFKYATVLFAVVALSVILTGILHAWFSYQELKGLLLRIQGEQAKSAASKIGQFIQEIEGQLTWTTQVPISAKTADEWRFDAARLFRQAPPVTEIAQFDAAGRERYRSSRQSMDVIGSMADFSDSPAVIQGLANKSYYGPVYFRRDSEPFMTIAVAGARPDHGVVVAEVNLKFIWDVVWQIKVGEEGRIYLLDSAGRLIAHPDISLVLRKMDLSRLAHVQAANAERAGQPTDYSNIATDLYGHQVLTAYAPVEELGWFVFAELPVAEAFQPLYDGLYRSALLLVAGLILAVFAGLYFARKMVVPIRTLTGGAIQLGSGDLNQRIAIATGDELEELGNQFNRMAGQLQDSYSNLERKVEERTKQLELATQAKSRFLATASHDLRQPLHALGLFVEQLQYRNAAEERKKIVSRIQASLSVMNELFNALLDVTRLDAGALAPKLVDFPITEMLKRIETTFAEAARERGLSLRVMPSNAWIRSDRILLERIIFNLVSNAIRYTPAGRVLVGCRKSGGKLRIEVWDTGVGIPADKHESIFGEFYRLKSDAGPAGFGLGLAIVDRMSRLLHHAVNVRSAVGKGSCFSVTVDQVAAGAESGISAPAPKRRLGFSDRKLVVVLDNDRLVLEGMSGLITSWGCDVVAGENESAILEGLADYGKLPDVIISDYHLHDNKKGIEAIAQLRRALDAPIPAFLMSGDMDPEPLQAAQAKGYALLHKPVEPMTLRATLTQIVSKRAASAI
jgi:signal transduction histidine kinase/CheY-like chemotaxis protein